MLPIINPVGFGAHGKDGADVDGLFQLSDEAHDDVGETLFFCFPDEWMDGADGVAAAGFIFGSFAVFAPKGFGGILFGDFDAFRVVRGWGGGV